MLIKYRDIQPNQKVYVWIGTPDLRGKYDEVIFSCLDDWVEYVQENLADWIGNYTDDDFEIGFRVGPDVRREIWYGEHLPDFFDGHEFELVGGA